MELVILFLLKTKCRFNCNSIFDRNPYLWLQIQQETVVLSLQAYVQGPQRQPCSAIMFLGAVRSTYNTRPMQVDLHDQGKASP